MIRPTSLPIPKTERKDHSMRVVEFGLALVALVVAGVLALLR